MDGRLKSGGTQTIEALVISHDEYNTRIAFNPQKQL
jgi:hypothetical protein